MALTKETINDQLEIVSEFKHIQVRQSIVVKEDGVELSKSYHRYVLTPDMDVSSESADIQGIAGILWTQAVKDAWDAHRATQQ